ncbi:hypothetical protein TNCV_5021361 [Trichonephila clavipes]|nr:hypothetical protein TNCV_5021361 [Trichonephila clavipes]
MPPHKPRKSAPIEYTTDEEDMIMYDLKDAGFEPNSADEYVLPDHRQVTWTTPELTPLHLTTTPQQREDVSAVNRFNVHRCPTQSVFSGTGLDVMTCLP